jgi:transcription elongation factor Elf1
VCVFFFCQMSNWDFMMKRKPGELVKKKARRDYPCGGCSMDCVNAGSLAVHQKKFPLHKPSPPTEARPVVCSFCSKTFDTEVNLTRHIRNRHSAWFNIADENKEADEDKEADKEADEDKEADADNEAVADKDADADTEADAGAPVSEDSDVLPADDAKEAPAGAARQCGQGFEATEAQQSLRGVEAANEYYKVCEAWPGGLRINSWLRGINANGRLYAKKTFRTWRSKATALRDGLGEAAVFIRDTRRLARMWIHALGEDADLAQASWARDHGIHSDTLKTAVYSERNKLSRDKNAKLYRSRNARDGLVLRWISDKKANPTTVFRDWCATNPLD